MGVSCGEWVSQVRSSDQTSLNQLAVLAEVSEIMSSKINAASRDYMPDNLPPRVINKLRVLLVEVWCHETLLEAPRLT